MPRQSPKNATLRDALVAKLGNPDRRRLHQLANGVRDRYGQMSLADAYAVLAAENRIRLDKYLVEPDLGRVRAIMTNGAAPRQPVAPSANGRRARARAETRLKEIVIDGARFEIDDPILPASIIADAKRMAGVYPLTYVFENSVREVVRRVMEKKRGINWFKQPHVTAKVLGHVATNRANEADVPWHTVRGAHDIYYTTIDDLLAIMFTVNDNKPVFESLLGKDSSVRHLVEIIETARHAVAHHRPLSADDFQRLKLNVRAWHKLMRERQHLI